MLSTAKRFHTDRIVGNVCVFFYDIAQDTRNSYSYNRIWVVDVSCCVVLR